MSKAVRVSSPLHSCLSARTLCMQDAAGRGPRQLFARVQRAKPFKAKARGPVFGCFRLDPPLGYPSDGPHLRPLAIPSTIHK